MAEKTAYEKLSRRDRRLVDEYLCNGMVQWKAYRDVIYTGEDPNYDSLRSLSSRKFADANIQAAIAERVARGAMPADEVLYRLGEHARGNLTPFLRVDDGGHVYFDFSHPEAEAHMHLIKKIKSKRTRTIGEDEAWEHEWTEVELYDAQAALKLIGQAQGLFGPSGTEDDPVQHAVKITIVNAPGGAAPSGAEGQDGSGS